MPTATAPRAGKPRGISPAVSASPVGCAVRPGAYALLYRWRRATFEGEQLPYSRALQVVLEVLTAAGVSRTPTAVFGLACTSSRSNGRAGSTPIPDSGFVLRGWDTLLAGARSDVAAFERTYADD